MLKGYDFFTARPGCVDKMICKVCGEICEVERSVFGPTSWASAMAKKNTTHDEFCCYDVNEEWHKYALELVQDIEKCHSPTLKKIMNDDLNKIIQEKEVA